MSINREHLQVLIEGATQLNVALSDAAITQLLLYLEELLLWSPKIDLISQTDPREIIRKHFLDSLAVIPFFPEKITLLDLGTGAGFPGLPIAIALPQCSVSLIEVRRKRVSFLKEVVRKIKTANVRIYEGRAEILAEDPSLYGEFANVITRATWEVTTYLRYASPFLKKTGTAIAMQGPQSDTKNFYRESLEDLPSFRLCNLHEYVLPFGSERRRLLIFAQQCFT
jgi:16S rRNA (guanine527-N7)-methyltransferase